MTRTVRQLLDEISNDIVDAKRRLTESQRISAINELDRIMWKVEKVKNEWGERLRQQSRQRALSL